MIRLSSRIAAAALVSLVLAAAPARAERGSRARTSTGTSPGRCRSRPASVSTSTTARARFASRPIRLPEVRIQARITVSSSDADGAQKFGEGIVIAVEDTASAVLVRTKYPDKKWHFSGSGHISYSVDYDIVRSRDDAGHGAQQVRRRDGRRVEGRIEHFERQRQGGLSQRDRSAEDRERVRLDRADPQRRGRRRSREPTAP